MEMKDREKTFFMEATLRICGSLEIEKAIGACFDFLRHYIPAEEIYLHSYLRDVGATHVFAMANKNGGKAMDFTVEWSDEMRRWLESDEFPINVISNKADEHPIFASALKQMKRSKVSVMLVRLELDENWIGATTLWADGWNRFTEEHLSLFLLLKRPLTIALSNNRRYSALKELKDLLADDKKYLQRQLMLSSSNEVVGANFGLRRVMEMVHQVAPLESVVLLRGETGTGKEVIGNTIHRLSNRKEGPFIKVNCGAIPDSLMDSELFGHEKGAFTGALQRTRGPFERAQGGTIFLDEIGELSPTAQVRLLRVLQDKKIERVGGADSIDVDIRVIAATHRDLEQMIRKGLFREDLYYRLQVFPIIIPPLRHRAIDVPALVRHFLAKKTKELGFHSIPELLPGAMERLSGYNWPGNVRELENMVERAMVLSPKGPIDFDGLYANQHRKELGEVGLTRSESVLLDHVVSKHVQSVLEMTSGRINGKNGAARLLGINPSTLRHKMRKLNIPFGRNVHTK